MDCSYPEKKQYRKLLRQKENTFKKDILNTLDNLHTNNPREYWKLIKSLRKDKFVKVAPINMNEWTDHFRALYANKDDPTSELSQLLEDKIQKYIDKNENNITFDNLITENEVMSTIKKLKNNKAYGNDYIVNEMIKSAADKIKKPLSKLFNNILKSGVYPSAWSMSWITPIHKKGDVLDPNNYRAISVSSCLSKLFTAIINDRLSTFCDNNKVIPREQIGFFKGYGTKDHLFVLKTIIETMKKSRKTLFCAFIDFAKAFDSVCHSRLLYKLLQLNIGSTFIKLIKNMYARMKAQIKQNNTLSTQFNIEIGTKQGCNISPNLFKIYLCDLPTALTKANCDPIMFSDVELSCLLYADDLVLVSQTRNGLQQSLNTLSLYCKRWQLNINFSKSKMIIFNTKIQSVQFNIDNKRIEVVSSYTYLGVAFHKNG